MIVARKKEREYFETSPEYGHLAHKMGSEYLAKLLSQVFSFSISTLFNSVSVTSLLYYYTSYGYLIHNLSYEK